jgi:hypothetical protein
MMLSQLLMGEIQKPGIEEHAGLRPSFRRAVNSRDAN